MKTPRNKFEKSIWKQLRRAKAKFSYEGRRLPYILACHYLTDWIIDTPLGEVIIETKGYLRPEDKRKLIAVKKQHPEIDLRIVFYRASVKDEKWATRNGFRYAINSIPNEWLLGL